MKNINVKYTFLVKLLDDDPIDSTNVIEKSKCEKKLITKDIADAWMDCNHHDSAHFKDVLDIEFEIKEPLEDCGIESMLQYWCLTDKNLAQGNINKDEGDKNALDESYFRLPQQGALRNRLSACQKIYYANNILTKYNEKEKAWNYLLNRLLAIRAAGYQNMVPVCIQKDCNGNDLVHLNIWKHLENVITDMTVGTDKKIPFGFGQFPWFSHNAAIYFCKD